ncbi:MAG: dienelactone hydrolase family protein [Gammaproteobacteria bacterium]|nr:dienelactone hydrolase family protein [Gammaproteobacteria bacterium]
MARNHRIPDRVDPPCDPERRRLIRCVAASGLAAAAPSLVARTALAAPRHTVVERDVRIVTADGRCDAAFFHPPGGRHPGVLIWTDVFGLRPVFRAMGRRLAALGYAVLVPNPFYRNARAPVIRDVKGFDFASLEDRAELSRWTRGLHEPGAAERDAQAYVRFLDREAVVDSRRKLGTHGYCMGGPLVLRTAALLGERIGAAASFHGGGLVTDRPDSPHLLAPKIKARSYFAIAASDDRRQPEARERLRTAFAAAGVATEIEVYPGTTHGWCIADLPREHGRPVYDEPDAERAWGKLVVLYQAVLA